MTLSIRQITAEHEAAHAVAYLALDYPIHRVEIEPEGLTLSTPRPTLRPLRDTAIVTAAGLVIEARYSVISASSPSTSGSSTHPSGRRSHCWQSTTTTTAK